MEKKVSDRAGYEQIIFHLQIIRTWAEVDWECGYVSIINPKCCEDIVKWIDDALELLKEQEPKSAIIEGSDVAHVGRCPSCHVILTPFRANYCYCCGRKVKWG